jgi:hypothetical protein
MIVAGPRPAPASARREVTVHLSVSLLRHDGDVPPRQLTRAEVAELAGRLHCLLAMIDTGRVTASSGMRYRLQGAVVALEAVLGRSSPLLEAFDSRITVPSDDA